MKPVKVNLNAFPIKLIKTYYNLFESSYPLGVEIGSKSGSLGFHGEAEHGLAINIEGQDASCFYSVLSGLGGLPPEYIPDSHYGTELQYIIENDQLSNIYFFFHFNNILIKQPLLLCFY